MLALAVGCGEPDEGVAGDPDPDQFGDTDDTGPPETVAILSGTATGGSADQDAFPLAPGSRREVARLVRDLTRPELAREVRRVVRETEVPDGRVLVGAVVAVGCDVPSDIEVSAGDAGGIRMEPVWTGVERLQECFAPVTSIGIALVDVHLGAVYQ